MICQIQIYLIIKIKLVISKSIFISTNYIFSLHYTYNTGIDTFTKARKIFLQRRLDIWLPDVLSIYLIIDAKNMGIDFSKFPCIANDDFEDIQEAMETNSEFRKRDNTINSIRNPSMIHKHQECL